jgi:hypothetical protein
MSAQAEMKLGIKKPRKPWVNPNRGFMHERAKQKNGDLEKAFADAWENSNTGRNQVNLQQLFYTGHGFSQRCEHVVTRSERYVTATAIQWLGTNCGFAFLCSALDKCGYRVMQQSTLDQMQFTPEQDEILLKNTTQVIRRFDFSV